MTFYETLTAAINDLTEFGFDSIERVDRWTEALRKAANASLTSEAQLDKMLRESLASIYTRLVDKGKISEFNGQIQRFTLERVKPKLRAELDRRIMASAQLIKRNKIEAVEKTLHRFQGWSTSIPAGGTAATEKVATKAAIKKSLAQLPFEERRVLIDQGHKLRASLSEILATDSGAIAAKWHSHYRQPGYNYREDHKERDGQVYLLKGSWALAKGFVKPDSVGYYEDITSAAEEPFCRCSIVWIYNIRDLPPDMVTQKGTDELARVRAVIAAGGKLAAPGTTV